MHKDLDVDGARIAGVFLGDAKPEPGRPTLVFLHEGLGSIAQWRDFPARVVQATGLVGFAYDRAGYGSSSPVPLPRPLDYMQREGSETLPRVLDAAGITGDVLLVGHSDGASIAIVFAAEYPDRTPGLVLEAPHVFAEDLSVASIAKAKVAYEQDDLRERLQKYHPNVDITFRGWNDAWLNPKFRASWTIESHAAKLQAPTLVVQCEDDPYGTLEQVEAIARLSRGRTEKLIFPTGGHAPHRTHEPEMLDAIHRFAASL